MNAIKRLYLTLVKRLKRGGLIPAGLANAAKERQRRLELKEMEIERLDRIRNPIKYRGK